jgi:DNA-binding NarL/FixJ family response regulator
VAQELSSLEQQIVTAAAGLEDTEIAEVVGSTAAEVKLVLDRVTRTLGLASRWELILYFYWHGAAEKPLVA